MEYMITLATKGIERIASKNRYFYRAASLYYKNMIKSEVKLAKINAGDKVLCIGGGPCPFSGILIHEYTGATVTIIDNDEFCVGCARNTVNNLGYESAITILHGDGAEFSPKDFSVIHIAAQVSPLTQVFYQLKEGCRAGAKILVRIPKKSLSPLYSTKGETFLRDCRKKAFHFGIKNIKSTALVTVTG